MDANRVSRPLSSVPAILAIAIAVYALAAGCGGKSENSSTTTNTSTTQPTPPPASVDTSATPAGGDLVAEGAKLYAQRCALCHGPEGRGNGPGAKGLNPPPRNHHDQAYMNSRTDAQLLEVIHNGKGAMPAWGKVLTERQMQAALAYVRELGKTP